MMKIENSMERQKRKSAAQLNVVAYSVVILSGVLLVTSGGFALSSKHKTIRREIVAQEESDLRVRDINHFLDEVPKCISSCIFPRILQQGCAHTDTSCICRNLRSLDDYDDSPKPRKHELKRELMEEVEVEVREVIAERSDDPCVPNYVKREEARKILRIEDESTDAAADIPKPNQPESVTAEDAFEIQIRVENTEGKSEAVDRPKPAEVESEKSAPQNETEIEEQRHFKHCVEECSLQEQIRAPVYIANYCWGLGENFEFPEVMVPMAKRQALSTVGSASAPIRASTTTRPLVSASASGASPSRITTVGVTTLPGGSVSSVIKTVTNDAVTVTASPTSTPTPTLEPSPGGLSTGAKIGLGVAIPLVVIFALVGLTFWWFRIRKKKQPPPVAGPVEPYNGMPELGGGGAFQENKRSELGGNGTEIKKPEAVKYPTEMDATRTPALPVFELPNNPSTQNITSELGPRSPVVRKPVNQATLSGFQPPWETGEQDGFMTPPMMANLGPGNGSVKSLALHEQPPSSTSLQPQNPVHSPPVSVSSTVPPYPSTSPVSPPTASNTLASSDDQELAQLEREMAAVRERKERLREVEALERREEELKRRISSLPGGSGGASPSSGASRVVGGLGGIGDAVEKTS